MGANRHMAGQKEFRSKDRFMNMPGTRESKKPGIQKKGMVNMPEVLGKDNVTCGFPPPIEKRYSTIRET